MEAQSNTRNELFKRNEIEVVVEAEKNPGFEEARKIIAEQTKKPEENIDVYNVMGKFGRKVFVVRAYVYDSVEDLKKAEQKTQKQKKADAEEAKKAAEEAKKAAEEAKKAAEEAKKVEEEAKDIEEPTETPSEDKSEEETKAVKEEQVMAEESKE